MVDEPIYKDDDGAYNRLAIPYITRAGVVCFRYRCLRDHRCDDNECPKYLGGLGVAPRIYNVGHLVTAGDSICVTEGELDALTLVQLGYDAVGIPGAQSWKPHWARLFEDFARILVMVDGDSGGSKFAKAWESRFPQTVELIQMNEGEDVNSMYLKEGESYFRDILG